ncbi:MAG TPA: prepilin-type N-terminal cleavage/methylation domain-containing protein [Thermoanaerobaculia bacterium]|nr:prepilin-type N-terminal cleavage/methylation domain-containing protein [Thermoanaerobaculia bacterium]
MRPRGRSSSSGFTLIELIVVVTIVGILAGIALVNVRGAQRKASENVLRANLTNMRKAIDDFYADKQRFPSSLQEVVDAKYMRHIPADPITKSADTWVEVTEEPDFEQGFDSAFSDDGSLSQPGMVDVKSGAEGETLDGTPYGEL